MTRSARGRNRLAGAAILVSIALSGTACDGGSGIPAQVGSPAPEYASMTIDGDSVRLADLRGRVVLLNIWATWCHPCREEIPELQALHERHAARGLEVVGVSVDAGGLSDAARIRAFADEFGLGYPIWLDPNERIARELFTIGVPTTVLIGRDGILRWRHMGPIRPGDRVLERLIEEALAEEPAVIGLSDSTRPVRG